jgi:hypothetical protein
MICIHGRYFFKCNVTTFKTGDLIIPQLNGKVQVVSQMAIQIFGTAFCLAIATSINILLI